MSDKEEQDEPKHDQNKSPVSARRAKKLLYLSEFLSKQESRINCKKVSKILKKSAHEHTEDEKATLAKHQDIVKRISKNKEKRELNQQRVLETEDGEDLLQIKCEKLAKIIQQSKKTVIYTGAGISTAASIPDYRGPQGVWTLLQKGEQLKPQDLSDAEPTLTHMCITQLHKQGHIKHVVSQNCDGLHLRSGLPRQVLSEVHGNMFIEICHNCRPHREYVRLFDVTENTGVRRHVTGRHCQKCGGNLKDTIVHFGEKGGMKSPYRWKEAVRAANKCDLILCLGSSLKILKKYACLWCMDRVKHKRPKLAIVNLQWTPKDESATLKINGRCDDVLERVLKILGYDIPVYSRREDPIFSLATCLDESEAETTNKKVLEMPDITPRLRSHGISRTPTPSDSSDSQSSLGSSSTDSCDINEDLTLSETNKHTSVRNFNFKNSHFKLDHCPDVKGGVLDSKEMCFSKSERICNEAKIAMQERLVNAKIYEMYGTCSFMPGENLINKPIGLNGLVDKGCVKIDGTVEQQPQVQYDPLRGGPFDPGPVSHEQKLKYLQTLQSQLEELKTKQRILKEQEQQHLKKPRHQQLKQVIQGGKQSNIKQVVQGCKQENIDVNQVNIDGKHERSHPHKIKQETDEQNCLKLDSSPSSTSNVKIDENDQMKPWDVLKFHQYSANFKVRGSHPRSLLGSNMKNSDHLSLDKDISNNLQVVALEKDLQQNLSEQKKLKTRLSAMLAEQHKLEEQVNLQHQNEQLRLHQHFIIQEQLRQIAQENQVKKEEILNLFLFQQQSLLAQQNLKLQCLRQNYVAEVQKVQNVLDMVQGSHSETSKKLKTLKAELRKKQMTSVMKNSIAISTAGNSLFQQGDPLKIEVKHENVVLSPTSKSPRKDHSIASILQIDNDSTPKTNNVNMDNAELDKPKTCDSCKFLDNYGMRKKWCSKCHELQCDHECCPGGHVLAKPQNRVESTFLENAVVPSISNFPGHDSETLENPVEQDYPIYNYVLDLEIPNVQEPKSEDYGKIEHTDHNYLNSKNDVDLNAKTNIMFNEHAKHENHLGHTVSSSVTTSNATATMSSCNSNLMSPIIPYASVSVSENDVGNKLLETKADIESDNTITSSSACFNSSSKIPERVTFDLNDDVKVETVNRETEQSEKGVENRLKPTSAVKHIRSHSQSEIYDQKQKVDNSEPRTLRHIRCRSHSELNDGGKEASVDSEADIEADAEDSNDVDDIATKNKEEQEDSEKASKKRKLARCYSVPGWFGKGLNIKKRRRY